MVEITRNTKLAAFVDLVFKKQSTSNNVNEELLELMN